MKNLAIRENHLYKKTYLSGAKAGGRYTVIYVLRDKKAYLLKKAHPLKLSVNRIGLTVTKKLGTAVKRNRVKRIIRAALAMIEKEQPLKKGYLVVISAKSDAVEATSTDIYREMKKQLQKLQMIAPVTAETAETAENPETAAPAEKTDS